MGKDQTGDFLRKADEAETNARWATDPDVRQHWKEVAGSYRMLTAGAKLKEEDRATALTHRLTA